MSKIENRLGEMYEYFDVTWQTPMYLAAYTEDTDMDLSPPIIKRNLVHQHCQPPKISKRRGRPKKSKRHESQAATLLLDKEKNKQRRV